MPGVGRLFVWSLVRQLRPNASCSRVINQEGKVANDLEAAIFSFGKNSSFNPSEESEGLSRLQTKLLERRDSSAADHILCA